MDISNIKNFYDLYKIALADADSFGTIGQSNEDYLKNYQRAYRYYRQFAPYESNYYNITNSSYYSPYMYGGKGEHLIRPPQDLGGNIGHYFDRLLKARDEYYQDEQRIKSLDDKLKEPQVIKKGTSYERQIKKETRTPKLSTNANNIMLTTSQANNPVKVVPKQEIVYNVPQGTRNITPKALTLADKAYSILKNPTTYANLGGGIIEGLLLNEALKRTFNNPWQAMNNPKPDTRSETDKAIMRARFGI